MGESSACLVRSLSQPSTTVEDTKEEDPIRRALTSSVSFGRFVSESLAWEKWSSFSHNRNLEDVERYSKPGSVAEKKAYFEAHYKRIAAMKAARSLDQQKVTVNNVSESSMVNRINDKNPVQMQEESHIVAAEEQGERHVTAVDTNRNGPLEERKAESGQIEGPVDTVGNCSVKKREAEDVCVEGVAAGREEHALSKKHSEFSIHLKDAREISGNEEVISSVTMGASDLLDKKIPILPPPKSSVCTQVSMLKPPLKRSTPTRLKIADNSTISGKKTPRVSVDKNRSTSKSLHMSIDLAPHARDVNERSSPILSKIANSKSICGPESTLKPPLKRSTPTRSKIADNSMVSGKKTPRVSVEKNRSTSKSLHMSIDLAPHARDVNERLSPILSKIANSKLVRNLTKTARQSTSLQTLPRVASENTFTKNLSVTPQPDNGRTKSLLQQSIAERVRGERKPKISTTASQSSTTHRTEERSPTVYSPFILKSEERAAKRKEFYQKLEEKKNAKEDQKEKLQAKAKERTRNVSKDICQPLTRQANTKASIHSVTNLTNVPVKKISTSRPCSPMIGRKQPTESSNSYGSLWRNSLKMDSIKACLQKNLSTAHSNKSMPRKSMLENAPPNIQHQM